MLCSVSVCQKVFCEVFHALSKNYRPPYEMATTTVAMHPTGIHSCFKHFSLPLFWWMLTMLQQIFLALERNRAPEFWKILHLLLTWWWTTNLYISKFINHRFKYIIYRHKQSLFHITINNLSFPFVYISNFIYCTQIYSVNFCTKRNVQ